MSRGKIVALILAAGYSSRMGSFKPLLSLEGEPVIARSIFTLREAGIEDVRVVVGFRAQELIKVLDKLAVESIFNENFDRGMFSSVLAGVRSFGSNVEGFFLLPGDIPLVKSGTIKKLLEINEVGSCSVVYPCYFGLKGHPPLITKKCFPRILAQSVSGNLRAVLKEFDKEACLVETFDYGVLLDMDTPGDYRKITEIAGRNLPTVEECFRMFEHYQVPEKLINHGWAVAQAALKIGRRLNATGDLSLDLELIALASLLHDIAKGRPNHAQAGAALLEREGYLELAKIVGIHMDLNLAEDIPDPVINEAMIVYLADKLVRGTEPVTIDERFAKALKNCANEPEILAKIKKRMRDALWLKEKTESLLSINNLLSWIKG